MEKFHVYCKNTNGEYSVLPNTSLLELAKIVNPSLKYRIVCARVNNVTRELSYRLYSPKEVEFLDLTSDTGMRAYIRSLCFVLYKAAKDIIPHATIRIEHPISRGYLCFLNEDALIDKALVEKLKMRMQEIVRLDLPFIRHEDRTERVIDLFREQGLEDKADLLSTPHDPYSTYYQLDDLVDYYYSSLLPSTGYLTIFDLQIYDGGVLLIGPWAKDPSQLSPVVEQPKMLQAFKEDIHFNKVARLSNVGNLNKGILKGKAPEMIKVTEALHEKQIANIASQIVQRNSKVVLISGPSSSGKTTFSKRLAIQLMTLLVRPAAISLDNYFVERDKTPLDETGDYDYESLYALNLELFNRDLNRLLSGEVVEMPTYNFETGKREYLGDTLKVGPHTILILEGIHALNPELMPSIDQSLTFKVYVSALTTISIDEHNYIPTTDNRLLRRIVRDSKYRGSSAKDTIARWPSVRRGEDKWIFPYQENADAMFNSALLFEMAVLKRYAEPVLRVVPKDCVEYAEASRLLKFLSFFELIRDFDIPNTSLLREFFGGSSFRY